MLTLVVILAWTFLLCLLGYGVTKGLVTNRWNSDWQRLASDETRIIMCLTVVALLVRLVPIFFNLENSDTRSFQLFIHVLTRGEDIYARDEVPYLPVAMYLLLGAKSLSAFTGLPFLASLKIPMVLSDIGITVMLYFAARRLGKTAEQAGAWGLLYATNPVSAIVSTYHGQLDSMPLLFSLLAWYSWRFGQSKHRELLSGLLLGTGIAVKTWPAFLIIAFLRDTGDNRKRGILLLATAIVPIISSLLYVASMGIDLWSFVPSLLFRNLAKKGDFGMWGWTLILNSLKQFSVPFSASLYDLAWNWGNVILLALMLMFFFCLFRKGDLTESLFNVILLFYTFTAGWGIQWMVWIVPFMILVETPQRVLLYSFAAATAYMAWYAGQFLAANPLAQLFPILSGYSMWQMLKATLYNLPWVLVVWWTAEKTIRWGSRDGQVSR